MNEKRRDQPRLSYLPFIARAAITALARFPDLNATFLHDRTIRWKQVNLGIAVDSDAGLIVPVIRDAGRGTTHRAGPGGRHRRRRRAGPATPSAARRSACRHLHHLQPGISRRGDKSIWQCDAGDLAAFKRVRLHCPEQQQRVSVGTWRRSIAALDKWARWAVAEGHLAAPPFRYVDRVVWTPSGVQRVQVNTCSEPDPGPAPVNFIAFEDYLLWRDVVVSALLPCLV